MAVGWRLVAAQEVVVVAAAWVVVRKAVVSSWLPVVARLW
jgi:hypothetical protein